MRDQMQLIVDCVYNDGNNKRLFEKAFEEFKHRIEQIVVGDINNDTSISIAVRFGGINKIGTR